MFALHECSPVSTVKASKRSNGWINQELCLSHDELKDLYWRTRESNCPETKAAYNTAKEAHIYVSSPKYQKINFTVIK